MDRDFRNMVRFKDFCKFVKNHKKGKAYHQTDSSLSTSDIFEDVMRDMWIKCDPNRDCKVSARAAQKFLSDEMGIDDNSALKKTIMDEMDANHDGVITFKEFNKYFTKLINP